MSKFVLIHGAWHGAWAWERVVPALEGFGDEVEALDLPGHGSDETPPPQVTLQSCVERVLETLDASEEPIVLAGHSLNGLVISEVAERRPEKIKKLVYVCAYLLQNGETPLGASQADTESEILQSLEMHEDRGTATLRPEALKESLYNDCTDEVVEAARTRLVEESLEPFGAQASVTDENFGRVSRVYIDTMLDHALSNSAQRDMLSKLPCERVYSMETSHSPMASKPEELARNLNDAARD